MKLITSGWTVLIVGISISLIILSFALFHYVIPYGTQTKYEKDYESALETEANKIPQTKKRVDTAIKMVNERAAAWNTYVDSHTPPNSVQDGGIDLSVNTYQLLIDTYKFRNNMQRAVNAQLSKGGVKLVGSGPLVPGPSDSNNVGGLLASYYNYPSIKFPVVIFNFGTIVVRGTYDQIMTHVRAYKSMPHYLAVTDALRLDGTAPILTARYNLSIVGFIRGKKIFGSVPEAAASTTGGGFGGGGRGGPQGGMPPGMGGPGGPRGMMGGMGGPGGPPSGLAGPAGGPGGRGRGGD